MHVSCSWNPQLSCSTFFYFYWFNSTFSCKVPQSVCLKVSKTVVIVFFWWLNDFLKFLKFRTKSRKTCFLWFSTNLDQNSSNFIKITKSPTTFLSTALESPWLVLLNTLQEKVESDQTKWKNGHEVSIRLLRGDTVWDCLAIFPLCLVEFHFVLQKFRKY